MNRHVRSQQGFTLLEVMIALTITGFVLGGLFTLAGGSKQLAWRSQDSLQRAVLIRAQINFSQLDDGFAVIEPILDDSSPGSIHAGDMLEVPERKTQASIHALQSYTVENADTGEVITGTRWLKLDLPQ